VVTVVVVVVGEPVSVVLAVTGDSIHEQKVEAIAPASDSSTENKEALGSWTDFVRVVEVVVLVFVVVDDLVEVVLRPLFFFAGGMTEVVVTTEVAPATVVVTVVVGGG
jgi:multidrug resistance efflux pump